jgi:hypothetical protein
MPAANQIALIVGAVVVIVGLLVWAVKPPTPDSATKIQLPGGFEITVNAPALGVMALGIVLVFLALMYSTGPLPSRSNSEIAPPAATTTQPAAPTTTAPPPATSTATTTQPPVPAATAPPPAPPRPRQEFKVCMGNGGGPSCAAGADALYNCDSYSGIGGGSKLTYDTLAHRFCEYNDNGSIRLAPNTVNVIYDVGGGQCGWTAFKVVCNP